MSNIKKNISCFKEELSEGHLLLIPELPITLGNAVKYEDFFSEYLLESGRIKVTLDLSVVKHFDSYLVIFIDRIKSIATDAHSDFEISGMTEQMQRFIKVMKPSEYIHDEKIKDPYLKKYFSGIGIKVIEALKEMKSFTEFLGDFIIKFLAVPFHPSRMRWEDFPYHFLRSGVYALPIVALIVFLIGIITGYQGAVQLKMFGADIYIADLIGISITRELSPLMTAILVAGRSGSAFAAEIGTMKVSEEIDALKSMGFDPMNFLVLPRVTAVMWAMPFLTIMADVAGIIGGLISSITTLEITTISYFNQMHKALSYAHVFTGVGKSIVFGFIIATIGCFKGFRVSGGADSVGRYTTSSVVLSVLLIIITDAIFTFIFQVLGI